MKCARSCWSLLCSAFIATGFFTLLKAVTPLVGLTEVADRIVADVYTIAPGELPSEANAHRLVTFASNELYPVNVQTDPLLNVSTPGPTFRLVRVVSHCAAGASQQAPDWLPGVGPLDPLVSDGEGPFDDIYDTAFVDEDIAFAGGFSVHRSLMAQLSMLEALHWIVTLPASLPLAEERGFVVIEPARHELRLARFNFNQGAHCDVCSPGDVRILYYFGVAPLYPARVFGWHNGNGVLRGDAGCLHCPTSFPVEPFLHFDHLVLPHHATAYPDTPRVLIEYLETTHNEIVHRAIVTSLPALVVVLLALQCLVASRRRDWRKERVTSLNIWERHGFWHTYAVALFVLAWAWTIALLSFVVMTGTASTDDL